MPRLLALLLVAVLTACSGEGPGLPAEEEEAAAGDGLAVVAAVYPLAWMAEQIAPGADVSYLAASGQDPHDLELTPQQRGLLEAADVVAYLGDIGFQPQVETAAADAGGAVVDVSEVLGRERLRSIEGHAHDDEDTHDEDTHDDDDDDHDDDHDDGDHDDGDDGDADDEEDTHDEDTSDDEAVDPHFWFDAGLMAEVATAMGDALGGARPDEAATFTENAAAVADDLEALDDEITELLAACTYDEVIVSHEAYAYLLEPNGLTQHGISQAGGHSEATPRRIADLAAEVREEGFPAVLTEPVEGRTDAEAVAREAGVETIEILSLDIVDTDAAEAGFLTLLREQAYAVAHAAECGAGR